MTSIGIHADLHARWARARVAALSASAAEMSREAESEMAVMLRVCDGGEECREAALRRVFDNSRRLAMSASQHLRVVWEIDDFREFLAAAPFACARGAWERRESAQVLRRPACDAPASGAGAFACDFWREAIDGFVMGLGDEARFVRHSCGARGDGACVDVLFSDAAPHGPGAYAPLTPEFEGELSPVVSRFGKQGVQVAFLGVREGALHYTMEGENGSLCGAGGKILHQTLEDEVRRIAPQFVLRDASPVAVYGEGT